MPHKYLALELQLQPSVLVERGNFRVCLIGVMERSRQGVARHVGIPKSSFKTVICHRACFGAHPGALEAAGLTLLFKRLLWSISRQNRRIIILLDARAIFGAAQRGRTSARSFQREVGGIAALQLAGNLRVHFLYVPREDNPADAPSRGYLCNERGRAKLCIHFGCGVFLFNNSISLLNCILRLLYFYNTLVAQLVTWMSVHTASLWCVLGRLSGFSTSQSRRRSR